MYFYVFRGSGIYRQTWHFSDSQEALLFAEALDRHDPDRLWVEDSKGQIRWMNAVQQQINVDKLVTAKMMWIKDPAQRKTLIKIEYADPRSVQSKLPQGEPSQEQTLRNQGYQSLAEASIKTGPELGQLLNAQEIILDGYISAIQYIESVTPYRWSRQGLDGEPLPGGLGAWVLPAASTQAAQQ